jgi:hypothetical protein
MYFPNVNAAPLSTRVKVLLPNFRIMILEFNFGADGVLETSSLSFEQRQQGDASLPPPIH